MAPGTSFAALFASALLVACGETHVTLLAPLVAQADAGAPFDAGVGGGDVNSDAGNGAAGSPP